MPIILFSPHSKRTFNNNCIFINRSLEEGTPIIPPPIAMTLQLEVRIVLQIIAKLAAYVFECTFIILYCNYIYNLFPFIIYKIIENLKYTNHIFSALMKVNRLGYRSTASKWHRNRLHLSSVEGLRMLCRSSGNRMTIHLRDAV